MRGGVRRALEACDRGAAALLVAAVIAYKRCLSPLLGRHCRFEPTCSVYFRQAVEKYGAVRGCLRGVRRICRCHPWNPGGYDPP
jgi:putative membrane protein insertion efficiency factor